MPKVAIEGLERLERKLGPELYSDALREFWRNAADVVMSATQAAAPNDHGDLRGSLDVGGPGNVFEVGRMNPPTYALVGTNVERKGFRYPWALEAGNRYHFRSPGADSLGRATRQPTKGWFSKAFKGAMDGIRRQLRPMMNEIIKRWQQ